STGHFPNEDDPTTVVLGRADTLNIAAAGTFLARMARTSGTPMQTQFASATSADNASVVFIGAVEQIPSGLLSRVRVAEHLRLVWPATPLQSVSCSSQAVNTDCAMSPGPSSADRSIAASSDEVRKRWADSFRRQGFLQQTLGTFQDWMEETF